MNCIDHGYGVVEFPLLIPDIADDVLDAWVRDMHNEQPECYKAFEMASQRYPNFHAGHPDNSRLSLIEMIRDTTMEAIKRYVQIYPGATKSITWRGDSHVISYGPGCHIGLHNDNAIDSGTQNEELIGSVISTSLILSDRCTGGALGFHYLDKEFLPRKGSLFAFPSNFMGAHYITEVTSGVRVARLEWFGHGKRTGNFEIVEQLVRLKTSRGEI